MAISKSEWPFSKKSTKDNPYGEIFPGGGEVPLSYTYKVPTPSMSKEVEIDYLWKEKSLLVTMHLAGSEKVAIYDLISGAGISPEELSRHVAKHVMGNLEDKLAELLYQHMTSHKGY